MNLRFAFRSLRRSPGFSILAVLILALGIGVNTAIFSIVYDVVLRPLNFPHSEQLVAVSMAWPKSSGYSQVSGPNFLDFQAGGRDAFQAMAAYSEDVLSVAANRKSEFTGIATVSQDFLRTMGVSPVGGRALVPSDYTGQPTVAMVSQGFWARHFGDVPFSSGRVLKVAGTQLEIVGLLPAGFHYPDSSSTEVWAPLFEVLQDTSRSAGNYRVVGRLRDGASVEQAQSRLSAVAKHLAEMYPASNKNGGVRVTSLANYTVRRVKTSLYILLLAVVLVLTIACANLANLLMVRASGIVRELAIRVALGASRARVIGQLLTETLLLGIGGAIGGLILARASLPLLLRLAPDSVPRLNDIQIDWVVLCLCGAIGVAAVVMFGVAPAMHASRIEPNRDLRSTGGRGVVGARATLRQIFVTAEVALCMVLLVSAGLLLKSFVALTSVNLGFHPENVLVAHISIPENEKAADRVFPPLLEKLRANPAVVSAGVTYGVPGGAYGFHPDANYKVSGETAEITNSSPDAGFSVVSGSFFETLGIPLIAGRVFSEREDANAPLTAVVNQALVKQSFGTRDPIGSKLVFGADLVTMKGVQIVGVVADARLDNPKDPPTPEIYIPYRQHTRPDMNVLVKTRINPVAFAQTMRTITQEIDPEASIKLSTLESEMAAAVATPRFSGILVSVFAGLAVLLAAIGIYGVIAYSVAQRTSEIGVRMALGADRSTVIGMVLTEALRLVAVGLVIGIAGSIAAGRVLRTQLFETSPAEPSVYGAMVLFLAAVALMAAFVPAWRASRVEPLEALRQE